MSPESDTLNRIVIVGYGVAGLTAGDALRDAGYDGELIIVGEEPHVPYSRPALSKAVLADAAGTPDLTVLELPEPVHGATEMLGRRAVRLRAQERILELDDGTSLAYDGLVIATGSRPRRLTNSPQEISLRTQSQALALRERLAERPSVTVLGGGPLGMEVASSARAMGCEVTVVNSGAPMVAQMGSFLGELCARAAIEHGVELVDDAAVDVRPLSEGGADEDRTPAAGLAVALASGRVLQTQLLVSAIGDQLNDDWLQDSGLLRDGRLVIDDRGRVAPGVVAAGDIAWRETPEGLRRVPLWMHAIDQAKSAAQGLLLGEAADPFVPRPYFWTELFGLHVRVAGPVVQGEPTLVDGDLEARQMLVRWDGADGPGTAASVNYRIAIPKLRRLAAAAPAPA